MPTSRDDSAASHSMKLGLHSKVPATQPQNLVCQHDTLAPRSGQWIEEPHFTVIDFSTIYASVGNTVGEQEHRACL